MSELLGDLSYHLIQISMVFNLFLFQTLLSFFRVKTSLDLYCLFQRPHRFTLYIRCLFNSVAVQTRGLG